MSEHTLNSAASENEIKIEMKFWEAVEITQETYNNYQENADNDLDNLNIEKFQNSQNQKGNFKLYHKFHDKDSNFSGITYIYDNEKTNTVNVAIACRGSVKLSLHTEEGKKDWLYNNFGMLWNNNTDSDNFATDYATCILGKIKGNDKYKNKGINLITLGHSKGGREAQKQMLRLLDEKKLDEKEKKLHINNIYCLTFNSAPCSKEDNKKYPEQMENCQNLITCDNFTLSADPLSYKDWLIPLAILSFVSFIVLICKFTIYQIGIMIIPTVLMILILKLLKQKILLPMTFSISAAILITAIIPEYSLLQLITFILILLLMPFLFKLILKAPCFKLGKNCGNDCGYFVESIALFKAHNLNSFWHEKSYYKDLKNMNVTDIIKLEKKKNLITLAEAERKKRGASANQTNVQKIN